MRVDLAGMTSTFLDIEIGEFSETMWPIESYALIPFFDINYSLLVPFLQIALATIST